MCLREEIEMEKRVAAAISDSARQLGIESLKDKQLEAVLKFVEGHDIFVSLPIYWIWKIYHICRSATCI